jgi:hypothetical protein
VSKWLITADLQLHNFPEIPSLNKQAFNTLLVALLKGLNGLPTHSPTLVIAGDMWNTGRPRDGCLDLTLTTSRLKNWGD